MKKSILFSLGYSKKLSRNDQFVHTRRRYTPTEAKANFALNSLGTMHVNSRKYCEMFFAHWNEHQVAGHFTPLKGIGTNPTGYADFRTMFREFAQRILGARTTDETAIVNDQSAVYCALFRMLAEGQLQKGKNVILYEKSAFPSDRIIIKELVRIINSNVPNGKRVLRMIAMPETETGLLDHEALVELIKTHKARLAVVAFGSGGVHWKTAQLLDLKTIGKAVKSAGGKLLVNIAHAVGIAELKLHEWQVSAAVGCLYKFMSGGPGAPSLVFIHEKEDVSLLPIVGWFSFQNPIEALQEISSDLKKGAQRIEASNPQVLGWLPAFAALEEYCKWSPEMIATKSHGLLTYFDALLAGVQKKWNSPLEVITPNDQRATEIVFTTTNKIQAQKLHSYLNKKGIICDIRDNTRIRIGMFPLITSYEEVRLLFNALWNFFDQK